MANPNEGFTSEIPGYTRREENFSVCVKFACSVGSSSDFKQTVFMMALKASLNTLLA